MSTPFVFATGATRARRGRRTFQPSARVDLFPREAPGNSPSTPPPGSGSSYSKLLWLGFILPLVIIVLMEALKGRG